MEKWLESFELITSSVRVNGCDKALVFEEHSRCVCRPEFAGAAICNDRSCLNFATQTECIECKSTCQNCRFQKKKYANLEVRETSWKGHGLYANEDIKKGQFLMEYLGELISASELASRMDGLTDKHLYVLQLKPGNFLDARNKGTIGRFINHSCEPNCTIELWTVHGRIRVGIFALTDIAKDAELNFDYKWSRSRRPPTKCYCGTASCRGFLEILTEQEIEESKVRKGLWRHKKDDIASVLQLADSGNIVSLNSSDDLNSTESNSSHGDAPAGSLFDLRGRLIPDRVVGKRLRIWWEGNQAFFEADVVEFVKKSGRYMCHYVADDTTTDEGLNDANSLWSWLDETQSETVIKKKDISMFADGVAVSDDQSHYSRQPTAVVNADDSARGQLVEHSRMAVKVSFHTAKHVVQTSMDNTHQDKTNVNFDDRIFVWDRLFYLLNEYYRVKASLSRSGPDHEIYAPDMQQVVLQGTQTDVSQARQGIFTAHTAYLAKKKSVQQQETDVLLARQSVVLTCDWRMVPVCRRSGSSVSSFLRHAVEAIGNMPYSVDDFLLEQRLLPRVQFNVDAVTGSSNNLQNGSSIIVGTVSDKVRTTLLTHLRNLVSKRLSCTKCVSYAALTLLARYLRFCDDSVVKDYTHLIAAAVVVAMKSQGQFRFKMLRKIVQSSYCQVFSREESNVGHSADSFIPRVLEIEQLMLYRLRYDLYVSDCSAIICAAGGVHAEESQFAFAEETEVVVSSRESKKDKHERHKEKQSRKDKISAASVPQTTTSASQRLQLECRVLCDEGLELASCLLLLFPSHLLGVPTELVSYTCILLVSLLTALLTPHSVLRCLANGEAPEAPSAAMAAVLVLAKQNEGLAEWCLEFFGNLVVHALSSLEGVACLADQRDHEGSSMDTLILDFAPKLMIRWIQGAGCAPSFDDNLPPSTVMVPSAPVRSVVADLSLGTLPIVMPAMLMPPPPTFALPPVPGPGPIFVAPLDMSAVFSPALVPFVYSMPVVPPVYGYDAFSTYAAPILPPQYPPPPPKDAPPLPLQPPAPAPRPPIPQQPPTPVRAPLRYTEVPMEFPSVNVATTSTATKQSSIVGTAPISTKTACPAYREGDLSQFSMRTRLPWLEGDFGSLSSVTSCSLQLSDLSDVSALTKSREVYCGAASVDSLARIGAGHLISRVGTTGDGLDTAVPITFRAWPPLKALLREVKKSAVSSASELGASNAAVSELCVFQHLHHHFRRGRSNRDTSSAPSCPYLIEPFAVVNVAPEEWHHPAASQMLFGGKFDANHEYLESLKETVEGGDDDEDGFNISSLYSSEGETLTVHTNANKQSQQYQLSDDWKQDLLYGVNEDARQSTVSQINAIRDKKYSLPDVTLSFLAFAPVHLALQSLLLGEGSEGRKGSGATYSLGVDFSLQLCRDLLSAADHLIYCGVFLKWLSLDHLYVTSTGRLLIGNLTGAVLASNVSRDDNSAESSAEKEGSHKLKGKKGIETKKRDKESSSGIPTNSFYSVAPEVLLGAPPSPDSTVYTAGSICAQILTGKTVVKNAVNEEKQLQYVFRILGTPKIAGYKDFDQLPLASTYGRHIKAEDGTHTESRSRSFKVIKSICSAELLTTCSFPGGPLIVSSTRPIGAAGGKSEKESVEESDGGGVLDLLRSALQLVPSKRVLPHVLLDMRVFSYALCKATEMHLSLEEFSQGRLEDEVLYLAGGRNVLVQTMTAENRMLTMQALTRSVRGSVADLIVDEDTFGDLDASLQKDLRDAKRDNVLFHLAIDRNPHQLNHLRSTLTAIATFTDGEQLDEEGAEGYSYNTGSGQDLQSMSEVQMVVESSQEEHNARHFVDQYQQHHQHKQQPQHQQQYGSDGEHRDHQSRERSERRESEWRRSPIEERYRDTRERDGRYRRSRSQDPELDAFGRSVRRKENDRDYNSRSRHDRSVSRERDRSDSRDRDRRSDRRGDRDSHRRRSHSRERRSSDRDPRNHRDRDKDRDTPALAVDPRKRRSSGPPGNEDRHSHRDKESASRERQRDERKGSARSVDHDQTVELPKETEKVLVHEDDSEKLSTPPTADWEQFTDIEPQQKPIRKSRFSEVEVLKEVVEKQE